MNVTLAGATGKEQLLYQAVAIKLAGRSYPIDQRIRRMTVRIYARAENHGDIGWPSIVRLAEANHLGEREDTRACRANREARKDTSAPRLGLLSADAASQDQGK